MALAVKLFEMQRISSGIALKDSVRIWFWEFIVEN